MGYHTNFTGHFNFDRPLEEKHRKYLKQFNETRRMKRDPIKALELPDPLREAVELPIGPEGAFFVGGEGMMGQNHDESIIDYNAAPGEEQLQIENWAERWEERKRRIQELEQQPGLWCQWTPSDDGTKLEWDQGEKFYEYVPWLMYLIANFIEPWGYKLNGEVSWSGEEQGDVGVIIVKDNEVTTTDIEDAREFEEE